MPACLHARLSARPPVPLRRVLGLSAYVGSTLSATRAALNAAEARAAQEEQRSGEWKEDSQVLARYRRLHQCIRPHLTSGRAASSLPAPARDELNSDQRGNGAHWRIRSWGDPDRSSPSRLCPRRRRCFTAPALPPPFWSTSSQRAPSSPATPVWPSRPPVSKAVAQLAGPTRRRATDPSGGSEGGAPPVQRRARPRRRP